jgi:hypothetical protein
MDRCLSQPFGFSIAERCAFLHTRMQVLGSASSTASSQTCSYQPYKRQETASVVLFERIDIRWLHDSTFLAQTLVADSRCPGKWVREIELHNIVVEDHSAELARTYLAATQIVVLHCPQLRAFRANGPIEAMGSYLASMSIVSNSTLEIMQITLNNDAVAAFPLLTKFRCLRELDIHFGPTDKVQVVGLSALTIPSLQNVAFRWSRNGSLGPIGLWILACRFEDVRRIELHLPPLKNCEDTLVGHFLSAHKHSCVTLALLCTKRDLVKLNTYLPHASHQLDFIATLPSPILFERWTHYARVKTLHLHVAMDPSDEKLWLLLNELTKETFTSALQVQITSVTTSEPFIWTRLSSVPDYTSFVGRILQYALVLEFKGVEVLDERGAALKMYDARG